jgi:hypothetical protein
MEKVYGGMDRPLQEFRGFTNYALCYLALPSAEDPGGAFQCHAYEWRVEESNKS